MSAGDVLKQIPIREDRRIPGARLLHPARRLSQLLTLALLIVIPASGLFRIDPVSGSFVMLDRQIWFSDIFIVMGFWIFVASLLVMMYSLVGAVFCGWMCPQNTVSEWANHLTERLLGRRARMMSLDGSRMEVARRRKSLLNYLVLGVLLLAAAMFYALIPLFYFYPPEAIWSFVTFRDDPALADSLHWIYFVIVAVMFIDIAVIRHLMCKYMCIYRVWQHSFKTRDTLHVSYDASRADDCAHCHYCMDACFLDLDPRKPELFDSCVNCGECIAACDELHARSKKLQGPGLLRLKLGDEWKGRARGVLGSFFGRAKAATAFTLLGLLMFAYGTLHYAPASFTVYRSDRWQGSDVRDYTINIAWKLNRPEDLTVRVEGLDPSWYRLERSTVHFDQAGRMNVGLHLRRNMPQGLHRFNVVVASSEGWSDDYELRHYAGGDGNKQ